MKRPVIPTNCCGNMCRDCVWNEYFIKQDKYEKWLKKNQKGKDSDPEVLDPNVDMFAKLEMRLREKEKLRKLAQRQKNFRRRNIVLDTRRGHELKLYLQMMKEVNEACVGNGSGMKATLRKYPVIKSEWNESQMDTSRQNASSSSKEQP